MKRVLLCSPTHFDVEYEINPWMHVEIKPDSMKASDAYAHLKSIYESLQCEIHEIPQVKGLPDMVYTANVGFVKGSHFLNQTTNMISVEKKLIMRKNTWKRSLIWKLFPYLKIYILKDREIYFQTENATFSVGENDQCLRLNRILRIFLTLQLLILNL